MYGSVEYLKSSHSTKARNRVKPAVREERVIVSHWSSSASARTWTTQLSAMVTATPISTATRIQRATTSGSLGLSLAGVPPSSWESSRRTKACMKVSNSRTPTTSTTVSSMALPTWVRPETAP